MLLNALTMEEFASALDQTRTVLIPFGVVEEHGWHLPLGTDTLIAERVCAKLAEQRPVFVAPAVAYGVCRSTGDHPGTVSITGNTLRLLALDIAEGLYRQGLRCFLFVSGHAGGTHNAILLDAGEELLRRHADLRVAVVCEYELLMSLAGDLVETTNDSHAGEIETSRLLYSHPELVRGLAAEEYPEFPRWILVRDKRRCWPGGVWGNPAKATAEKGRRLEEAVVAALGTIVDRLENGPVGGED